MRSTAEPVPTSARTEIERLLESGDLFRYEAGSESPAARLEAEFAELVGSRYALAVSSCSAALFLALKALDLPRGACVLVPAFTFAAVPSAVVHADGVPVLVECGADCRIDLQDFHAKLADAEAVLLSHMRGHMSNMDAIVAAAEARGIPIVEDAAHALGATWRGRAAGTLGRLGCYSFQSYKLANAGEGGMLVTDDPDLIARAVIMSGAYERNWAKHQVVSDRCAAWQDRLPIYGMRMSNLAAAVLRPQLAEVPGRAQRGRRNHDRVAARIATSPWIDVPAALPGERRAPDSIQFNLVGMSDAAAAAFVTALSARGVAAQVFGLDPDNARAFWNWRFLPEMPDLPRTRAMLRRACDVRLPTHLAPAECDAIAGAILSAIAEARSGIRAVA